MQELPMAGRGQSIGLLGGSFDPPHAAHLHISKEALKWFGLDHVWWLVSPGNPLKPRGPAPLPARMAAAQALVRHPQIHVTDIEARIGTRHTAATIAALQLRAPGLRFVWLMGADNLAQFHRWQDWQTILQTVPIGVLARPGLRNAARFSKTARIYRSARMPTHLSRSLARTKAPAWCFVNLPMMALSSTAIRARGDWG